MDFLTDDDDTDALRPVGAVGRRVFIQGVGWVGAALLGGFLGGCEELLEQIRDRPIRRRLRVGSPEVDADIALYRQAVTLMKGLSSDPRNWTAQATIHGTPSGFNFCEHGTDHFFDWHRAYLFYFEKICQKLTGNSQFGLPYWNWNQNPDIHPAFLDPSSPLFLARSRTSMAGVGAVSTPTLDLILGDGNFFTFRQQLEGTPHNTVHSYIGGTMGGYASALDPLFWTHHCMVDYCWYKWNADLGHNTTNDPTWVGHVNSHFVDADKNPASDTAGVTTLMPLLSYQYESSAIGSSPASASIRAKAEYQRLEKRIREGANVRFDITQRVHLADRVVASIGKPLSIESRLEPDTFARIINVDSARDAIFATIGYAQLPASSDFSVRVFVNFPAATAGTPDTDPHYAGSFAFFGTEAATAAMRAGERHHQPAFLVNLTGTIRRLKERGELRAGAALSLQLVPTPFGGKFERDETELTLTSLEIIVTPVIVTAPRQ